MKPISLLIALSVLLFSPILMAEKLKHHGKTYGDAWYQLEKQYPSPERRYSRKELERARLRANNRVWMEQWGSRDPIYQSDQYRGQSGRYYRTNRFGHRW